MKIKAAIQLYLKHLRAKATPFYTIKGAKYGLKSLSNFLEAEQVYHIEDITTDILAEYQEDIAFRLTAQGKLLSLSTQEKLIIVLRNFTKFLKQHDYLLHNPAEHIKPPKRSRRLPKSILTPDEMQKLINTPNKQTSQGYRDRVIIEILYDTGMRRSELANVKLPDMDLKGGYIRVSGKGNKDRVVPLSRTVCDLIQNYIVFVRPKFIKRADSGYLILNRSGNQMAPNGIYIVVKRNSALAGIKKKVTAHTMRHYGESYKMVSV